MRPSQSLPIRNHQIADFSNTSHALERLGRRAQEKQLDRVGR